LRSPVSKLPAAAKENAGSIRDFADLAFPGMKIGALGLQIPTAPNPYADMRFPQKNHLSQKAGDFLCGMRPKRFSFPPLAAHFLLPRQKKMGARFPPRSSADSRGKAASPATERRSFPGHQAGFFRQPPHLSDQNHFFFLKYTISHTTITTLTAITTG
jgi:hypothetical protein